MADDYLSVNAANWDARADVHVGPGGYRLEAFDDPEHLSDVVTFDRPLLGDIAGLEAVHLQCHIGTDTISLARLGAQVTGVDLSQRSLTEAAGLAKRAGADVEYVVSDVYAAPEALGGRRFDLVYTGIGALCWLPDIERWAGVVARLLKPGGRLFVRDGHPVLNALAPVVVGEPFDDAEQQQWMTPSGGRSVALEFPYFEQEAPMVWRDDASYAGTEAVSSPESHEWNHGLGEIVTAVLKAGLTLELLVEHDSAPWAALPDVMTQGPDGEYRLTDRPERLPATFTLAARKPAQA